MPYTTAVRVAFLRGINVGQAKRVAMADLRAVVESLGYQNVRTLLNSGNLIFTVPRGAGTDAASRIEKAVASRLGVSSRVTVMTGVEVAAAVRENPLARTATTPSRLQVVVLSDPARRKELEPLLQKRWQPEALGLGARVIYMWCPDGVIKSPLAGTVSRVLGDAGTARNMATMTKLLAMLEGSTT